MFSAEGLRWEEMGKLPQLSQTYMLLFYEEKKRQNTEGKELERQDHICTNNVFWLFQKE